MKISKNRKNKIEVLTGENDYLKFEIAPELGGKVISVYNKKLEKEFLWRNKELPLEVNQPGTEYDPNFWGGIDELIPNDIPETIDSIPYPDHGELWTTPLQYELLDNKISVFGKLKLSELYYEKTMFLDANSPLIFLEYKIKNLSKVEKHFLWKFHAALAIEEGDTMISDAQKARVVYPESSRFKNKKNFSWPMIGNFDVSKVQPRNNTMDFFYLYEIQEAEMKMSSSKANHLFSYRYDKEVFPYQWYFASYGAFLDHYTAILEPASSMPVSVNEAKKLNQCSRLLPNEEIKTTVKIFAGAKNN